MTVSTTPRPIVAEVASALTATCADLCVVTPCGVLAPLIGELERINPGFDYAYREDNATALAAGTALGGKRAMVLMQNSGLGQSVNVLASLIAPFAVPIGLVISLRGTGIDDTRENQGMGRLTEPLLAQLDIPFRRLTSHGHASALGWFDHRLTAALGPSALLVPPDLFGWNASR